MCYGHHFRARFLQAVQVLIETDAVNGESDFCLRIGRPTNWLYLLRYGSGLVMKADVNAAVEEFKINPIYLIEGTGRPLITMYMPHIDGGAASQSINHHNTIS